MPPHPQKSPSLPPITLPAEMGPAMRALSPSMRAFVDAKMAHPHMDNTRAALMAGYSEKGITVTAHRLAHDDRIIAALHDQCFRRMKGMVPLALDRLEQLLRDESKDPLNAIKTVLDRGGMPAQSQQSITVEKKETDGEQIERIARLAKMLGKNPLDLLGQYGITVAGGGPTIEGTAEGIEDIL